MVGGDGFQDMELFGKSKQAWLAQFLDLPNGIPSHDTLGSAKKSGAIAELRGVMA